MARKKARKLNTDNLQPKIASGITQGVSAEEALSEHPILPVASLSQRVGHMQGESGRERVRFVAEPNGQIITDATGRRMQDVTITVHPDVMNEMRAGYKCLRCHEPQDVAFPETCDLCGYAMRDRQILDFAMEFEGDKHIGPKKPINEYLDAQDERVEKRQFVRKVLSGHSGRIPKEWLRDATLLEDLTPDERQMIRAT